MIDVATEMEKLTVARSKVVEALALVRSFDLLGFSGGCNRTTISLLLGEITDALVGSDVRLNLALDKAGTTPVATR